MPVVPSGASTATHTLLRVFVVSCTVFASRTTAAFRSPCRRDVMPLQVNDSMTLSPRLSRYFSSFFPKSIFTCFSTIQSSPMRNSSPWPWTTRASTAIRCWYWVVPRNLHTPSTRERPPPNPSTMSTGACLVTQRP
ncbi:hypothetical protein PF010_g27368, partial [Phytophthora fragariae]